MPVLRIAVGTEVPHLYYPSWHGHIIHKLPTSEVTKKFRALTNCVIPLEYLTRMKVVAEPPEHGPTLYTPS